jgi:hypothetical protein
MCNAWKSQSPSTARLKGIVPLQFCNGGICTCMLQHYHYIIVFIIGVGVDLAMDPLNLEAAVARAVNAVKMATTANTFAKFCTFMNTPPTLFI